jgi:hypothetical protein
VNEDDDQEGEEELSESEPSIDNFDKKEIMKLMPIFQKKKKKKGKSNNTNNKSKKLEKYFTKRKTVNEKNNADKNKNIDLDIVLYNPLKIVIDKKVEEKIIPKKNIISKEKSNNSNNNPAPGKSSSNSSINLKKSKILQIQNNKNITGQIIPTEPNYKDDYTQTEEIFFRMHWTFFVGKFRILNGRKINYNNLPSISTIPFNMAKMNNNYIHPFSFPINKRKDLLISGKIKNTNWTKFGNIFVDEKNINPSKNQNGNIKLIKSNINDFNKNSTLKDKTSIKPIFLTRFNRNTLNRKGNNFSNKGSNKNSTSKDTNKNDNNIGNKRKNSSEGKKRDDNNKEKDNINS